MVALENRFVKTQNGNVYSTTVCDYAFWSRYLQVFDDVIVFARVEPISEQELDKSRSDGPNVAFKALPAYVGPWQYLKQHLRLRALAKQATEEADAFILRVPGRIGTLLWHELVKRRIPYGVEVMGSSVDSAKAAGANLLLRGILRLIRRQKQQCQNSSAALYITESYLQSLYPPGGWSIVCSDVDLLDESIIDDNRLRQKHASLKDAVYSRRPFRVCHAGTMAALYKGQDVLIEAISLCCSEGQNIELTLLGDGRHRHYFEDKARKLRIAQCVHFLGMLPPGIQVRAQLDRADLFVFPSLAEGQGRILIEAMARGLPCIGSRVGGIPELLSEEDLVSSGDAVALARKIGSVRADEPRLLRMSRQNLEKAKEFHIDKLNPRRLEFYRKVAEISKTGTDTGSPQ